MIGLLILSALIIVLFVAMFWKPLPQHNERDGDDGPGAGGGVDG